MRLSDMMKQTVGTFNDICGAVENVSKAILESQRFELSDDVVAACIGVSRSRPSSLLAALPLCRLPFRSMWLEWRPHPEFVDNTGPHDVPKKMGVLLESLDDGSVRATWAWHHDNALGGVTVAPLGALIDWNGHGIAPATVDPEAGAAIYLSDVIEASNLHDRDPQVVERSLLKFPFVGNQQAAASEVLAATQISETAVMAVTKHTVKTFNWFMDGASPTCRRTLINSWRGDLTGEVLFVQAVVAMLNSRNAVESEAVDLTRLNKARTRSRKPVFLSYYVTRLKLGRAQRDSALGSKKGEARRHSVRGHFKVRSSGIFWWSSFERGSAEEMPTREAYAVTV